MDLNLRAVNRILANVILITGIAMVLPFLTALIYGENQSAKAFALVMLAAVGIGIILIWALRGNNRKIRLRDGFLIVSCSWILISVIGAFPYMIEGSIPHFVDAFFESTSGFSTTGASIVKNVENLPKSILMWRSFSQWIGGMGIIVLVIALLPSLGIGGQDITSGEAPRSILNKITPKMHAAARGVFIIYICMTFFETVLLIFGGMDFFDALTYSFATVSTGGFDNYNDGLMHFDSAYIESVIGVFMLASGVSFGLYYLSVSRRRFLFLKNQEFRFYLYFFAGATVFLTIGLMLFETYPGPVSALRKAAFQAASVITTTGFATDDFASWPTLCVLILLILFFVGGCSSSASGGIKIIRIIVLLKMIRREISLKLHPEALVHIRVDHHVLDTDSVQRVSSFAFLYTATVFAASIILSLGGGDIVTCLSASASSLGNIGRGFGLVGPMFDFSIFSHGQKIMLSLMMIAGRLELISLFMMLSARFWNPNE